MSKAQYPPAAALRWAHPDDIEFGAALDLLSRWRGPKGEKLPKPQRVYYDGKDFWELEWMGCAHHYVTLRKRDEEYIVEPGANDPFDYVEDAVERVIYHLAGWRHDDDLR